MEILMKVFLISAMILLYIFLAYASEFSNKSFDVLLPPPPESMSRSFSSDVYKYELGLRMRDTERGKTATLDADFSHIPERFSDAFGCKISKEETPAIYNVIMYASQKMYNNVLKKVKTKYNRVRPYVYYNSNTCYKKDEKSLRGDGSYPSGHSATAWIMALILTEIRPERAEYLIKHGYEVGQSRVICGYHWQSDVDSARILSSAYLAFLHGSDEFQKLLEDAKRERESILK